MEYSEKTTVFSYGAMLANLFDLADIRDSQFLKTEKVRFKTIILRDSDTQLSKLADADIRQKMLELIKEMTTKNPDRRISLRNATERLYAIMSKYKSENAKVIEHPKKRARHVRATNISQFPFMLFKKESDAALLQTPTFPNTIAMHFVTPPEPTMPHLVSQGRKRSR
jgi:L-rhamnose mutarotase